MKQMTHLSVSSNKSGPALLPAAAGGTTGAVALPLAAASSSSAHSRGSGAWCAVHCHYCKPARHTARQHPLHACAVLTPPRRRGNRAGWSLRAPDLSAGAAGLAQPPHISSWRLRDFSASDKLVSRMIAMILARKSFWPSAAASSAMVRAARR